VNGERRILVIGPFGPGFLAESYARALERNGNEVFRFDSDRAYSQATSYAGNRWFRRLLRKTLWDRLNATTLEVVRAVRPSFVLAFKAAFLNPETIRRIRIDEGFPIANYYPDNPYCGVPLDPRKTSAQRRDIIECLKEYNRVFTWEKGLVARLTADRVSAAYLPFGVDPEMFQPLEAIPCHSCGASHDVAFIGLHTAVRQQHLDAVRNHSVAIWGPGWGRAQKRFRNRHVIHEHRTFGLDAAKVYSSTKISLNLLNRENIPGHNMRTFEIPASGGVMLATYTEAQAEFFPEGEASWYYRDPGELDDLIERLLRNGQALEQTRQRALEIAKNHTYYQRAESLFADLRI
jgi:hypothetical protein